MGDSTAPVMSADGRFVVFLSTASNLVTNDTNGAHLDVFIHELASGQISLVSVSTNGGSGNAPSSAATLSGAAQVAAFVSAASNLVADDTNGVADVFIRDLANQTTRLASRGPGGLSANGPSSAPQLTADGRFLFFESRATNLVPGFTSGGSALYRFELLTGETIPIAGSATNLVAGSWSFAESGEQVLFVTSGVRDLLIWQNLGSGAGRELNSAAVFPPETRIQFQAPWLSADGRAALFMAGTVGVAPAGGLYRLDLAQDRAGLLAPDLDTLFFRRRGGVATLAVSPDGSGVFFEAISRDLPDTTPEAVFAWDAQTQEVSLISSNRVRVAEVEEPQPFGQLAASSADGRFVAWIAYAQSGITWPSNEPLQLYVQDRFSGEIRRITRNAAGGPSTVSTEFPAASFSGDGRFLVFQSQAPDLVADDGNDRTDVFLYDWQADRLEALSLRNDLLPSQTHPGLSFAGPNSLSADGRFLAFVSTVRGLTAEETRAVPNVFVRDLVTSSIRLASVNETGAPANGSCRQAVISSDGRWVAFTSLASNLAASGTHRLAENVFLADLIDRKVYLVSRNKEGNAGGNAASSSPVLAPDGSRAGFVSSASDLVEGDLNQAQDVFVYDRLSDAVRLVSATPAGLSGDFNSYNPVFSPDGAWLAFESNARNLLPGVLSEVPHVYAWRASDGTLRRLTGDLSGSRNVPPQSIAFSGNSQWVAFDLLRAGVSRILLHDLAAAATSEIVFGAASPALDFEGKRLAYLLESAGPGPRLPNQVVLLDRATGVTNLASVALSGSEPGNGRSFPPLITPDGRFVVFASKASNLVSDDQNAATDLFVRDIETGTTLLLTRGLLGSGAANDKSALPRLGRDGRTVVFTSFASDLAVNDFNAQADLFAARLPGPESGFRILTITRVSTGETTLVWAATEGASYHIEFAEVITGPWQQLETVIQVDNNQASAVDRTLPSQHARFYRVLESRRTDQ